MQTNKKTHPEPPCLGLGPGVPCSGAQGALERILKKNADDNSTWFYLNKQAAFVDTIALCSEADESSLGPIKIILRTNDIENTIKSIIS